MVCVYSLIPFFNIRLVRTRNEMGHLLIRAIKTISQDIFLDPYTWTNTGTQIITGVGVGPTSVGNLVVRQMSPSIGYTVQLTSTRIASLLEMLEQIILDL